MHCLSCMLLVLGGHTAKSHTVDQPQCSTECGSESPREVAMALALSRSDLSSKVVKCNCEAIHETSRSLLRQHGHVNQTSAAAQRLGSRPGPLM